MNSTGEVRRLKLLSLLAAGIAITGSVRAGPNAAPARAPAVEFLDLSAARKAIVDESKEPYFKLLQPMEMRAKTGSALPAGTLEQQRDACRKRYQAAVQEFTAEDKETLRWYVAKLGPLVADYPLYAKARWSFLKLSPAFEGGWPHTRGSHIVLSEPVIRMMERVRQVQPEWKALESGGEILLHEQCHVLQREYPGRFRKLYVDLWGFTYATQVKGCKWLTVHQIVNPDGVDTSWVFPVHHDGATQWILPSIVLDGGDPDHLGMMGMHEVAIDVEPAGKGVYRVLVDASGKPRMQPLSRVPDYTQEFYSSDNIYHPNEAAADLFARTVFLERVAAGHVDAAALARQRKEIAPLQAWFQRILAG